MSETLYFSESPQAQLLYEMQEEDSDNNSLASYDSGAGNYEEYQEDNSDVPQDIDQELLNLELQEQQDLKTPVEKPKKKKTQNRNNDFLIDDPVCISKKEIAQEQIESNLNNMSSKLMQFQNIMANMTFNLIDHLLLLLDHNLQRPQIDEALSAYHKLLTSDINSSAFEALQSQLIYLTYLTFLVIVSVFSNILLGAMAIIIWTLQIKFIHEIHSKIRQLQMLMKASSENMRCIQKCLNRYEEAKFMQNGNTDEFVNFEVLLYESIAELNEIYTGKKYESNGKMKSRYNDTVLNSINFDNVKIKYEVIRGNKQEMINITIKFMALQDKILQHLDREQTTQISKQILKDRDARVKNGYTKDLQILRDLIRNVDFELSQMILNFDTESHQLLEKYTQLEYDLKGSLGLYFKCKSLFKLDNIEQYKQNRKFMQKMTEEVIEKSENEIEEPQDLRPVLPRIPKTEIFENFELIDEKPKEAEKKSKAEYIPYQPAARGPSFDFLDELKIKLDKRQTELVQTDQAVYKEFDIKTKKFKEISKEERDQKEAKLKVVIQKIEADERQENLAMQRAFNSQNQGRGRKNPLLMEMMNSKVEQDSDDEVFS